MKFLCAAVVACAALGAGGCAGTSHDGHGHGDGSAMTACPMCAKGMAGENVWCEHCKAGFVGGEKVGCKGCFAAKTGGEPCPKCAAKKM